MTPSPAYVAKLARAALRGEVDARSALREIARLAEAQRDHRPPFVRGEIDRGVRDYRIKHWGTRGAYRAQRLSCADPSQGPLVELGQLVSVTYETTKAGDPPGTWYTHEFTRPLPVLAYSSGGLVVCGGHYRVTWRGIVG